MDTVFHNGFALVDDEDLTQYSPYEFDALFSNSEDCYNQAQLTVEINDDAEDDFAAFFLAVREYANGDTSITSRHRMWTGIEYTDPSEVVLDYPCYFDVVKQNSCVEEKFF